jgi:putative ABC transport system permease protein
MPAAPRAIWSGRAVGALDRKLIRDLRHIWLQVLAIALVIGCGVAMYVMSLATLRSLEETRFAYYERYRFADIFAEVKRAPDRLDREIASVPGVARVETRVVAMVTLDVAGMDEPARGLLISVPERHSPELNGLHLRMGRSVRPGNLGEVVLNEAFAEAHGLRPGDHLHAVINGRKRRLDVVGVALSPEYIYSLDPGAMMPDDRRFGVMWVGREMLAAAYDLEDSFNSVSLTMMRGASEDAIIAVLDRILGPYGGVGAYGRKDQISHWYISNEMAQLEAMARVAPAIFLGVAAFLLHIVVSRLIATEREQIGLLKAFGYSALAVGWHYTKFVLVIVGIGIVLGFVGGAWLGRGLTGIYTDLFRFPFFYYWIDFSTFVVAALVSVLVALAGTLGAVRRAARLPPAVAMQPAPPPIYRQTALERFGAILCFGQATRMVLRHVMRRPLRSGLTALGIAMSVAILVSSMFMLDSIEMIIDVQFNRVNRQDVTVALVEAKPAGIVREFESMAGVLRAEPVRAVAVRFRNRHISRRTALIGMASGSDLGRLLDRDLRAVSMPPEGLVLNSKLAEVLGVGRGDRLVVEAMEGRRPTAEIPVSAVVEEYLGTSAYMDLVALNRFMGDQPMVSLAYLQIDSLHEPELYRQLKDAPAVAGVTLEKAAVESFREILAETMLIMTTFYMLFAGMIAFGVVYNSARISLSERGRELASLRVLGFTRAEVSWILLGEFALLTVAALVPGFVIGYGLSWWMAVGFETELFRIPLVIEHSTYGFSAVVVLSAALLTGLVVRRRIDHLDLVAVLKTRE